MKLIVSAIFVNLLLVSTAFADIPKLVVGGHDLIVCPTIDNINCVLGQNTVTPSQYAEKSGYSTVHKTYVLLTDTTTSDMIMQVSNPTITPNDTSIQPNQLLLAVIGSGLGGFLLAMMLHLYIRTK